MKLLYTLALSLFTAHLTFAQFSSDPSQPMPVCNAAHGQSNVISLPDGNDGNYLFWLDNRGSVNTTIYALYGQHLDSGGNPLWANNGKVILDKDTVSIKSFNCVLFDGGILVTWVQGQNSYNDSMFVKKINPSGNDVWAQPTLIESTNFSASILGIETYGIKAIPNDSGAFINYSVVYIGGSSGIKFNRINFNGVKQWAASKTNSLPGYTFFTYPGIQNTFYSLSRGNGMGSGIYIQKYNMQSVPQWANPVDISQGVSGNGLAGNCKFLTDNSGNSYVVWDSYSSADILLTKIDAAGNFAWTPSYKSVVNLANTLQGRSDAVLNNNNLFITWSDNRITGQATAFTQKYNASGAAQWIANGVQLGVINSNYCYPKIAYSDSGSVAIAYIMGAPWELYVQRVRSNGTLTWGGSGKILASDHSFINYADYTITSDSNGCNAVFWHESSTGDLYGAKVCSDGTLVTVAELLNKEVKIFPNPTADQINIELGSSNLINEIEILDMQGRILKTVIIENGQQYQTLNVNEFSKGVYLIKIKAGNESIIKKVIIK